MTTPFLPLDSSPSSESPAQHHFGSHRVPVLAYSLIVTFLAAGRCFAGEPYDVVRSHRLRSAETVAMRLTSEPSRLDRFSMGEGEDYFDLSTREDQERRVRHGLEKAVRRAVCRWGGGLIRPWLGDDETSGDWTQWVDGSVGQTTIPLGVRRWIGDMDVDLGYGHGLELQLAKEIARRGPDWFRGGRVEVQPLDGSVKVTMGIGTGSLGCSYSADGGAMVSWHRTW